MTSDEKDPKKSFYLSCINHRMIPTKIGCFLANAVIGCYVAFLNVFFVSVGLTKFQAGIITGMTYALPTIVGPFWGYLADRTNRRVLILIILCVGAAVHMFSMPYIARMIYPMSRFQCNNNTQSSSQTNGSVFTTTTTTTITLVPQSEDQLLHLIDENCEELKQQALNTLFFALLAIMLMASIFLVPLNPYIDAIILSVVKTDDEATYGGQRIFGSIGICAISLAAGAAADSYSEKDLSPYTAVFFFFLPCVILLIPAGSYMISQLATDEEPKKITRSESESDVGPNEKGQFHLMFMLCCRLDVMIFLLTVLISGVANNIFLNFSFLYITEVLEKSKTEMTFGIIVATLSETLIFPFASKIINLLKGPSTTIIVGMAAASIRWLVMSMQVPFELFLALQSLSAFSFALTFAAMMEHLHMISPDQIKMTMSTLMTTLFFVGSNFIANVAGSKVYEILGGRDLFFTQGVICGIWTLLLIAYHSKRKVALYSFQFKSKKVIGLNSGTAC